MRRRKEPTLGRIGLLAIAPLTVLLMVGAGVGALSMWLAEPGYWQHHQRWLAAMTPAELQRHAQRAEADFVAWLTGEPAGSMTGAQTEAVLDRLADALEGRRPLVVAGGEPRTLEMSLEQINAWLATKGRPWLDRQGLHIGGKLQNLIVACEDGRPILAFQLQTATLTQVVSLVIETTLRDPQTLYFKLHEVRGGTLGVRSGSIGDPIRMLEDQLDEDQRSFLKQLRQGITVQLAQVLKAAEAEQRVVIKQLRIEADKITVTLAGEPTA